MMLMTINFIMVDKTKLKIFCKIKI